MGQTGNNGKGISGIAGSSRNSSGVGSTSSGNAASSTKSTTPAGYGSGLGVLRSNGSGYNEGQAVAQTALHAPAAGASDPWGSLFDLIGGDDGSGGGSGGSGGGGGADISGILAQIDQQKNDAANRYNTNKSDTANMYGQLTQKIADYKPTIQSDFTNIQNQNTANGAAQQQSINQALADQQARRAASAQARGVSGPAAGVDAASDQSQANALAQVAGTQANWNGFLGAEQGVQVGNNDALGTASQAAGLSAQDALTAAYNTYIQNLDNQRASAISGAASSGGGGGSSGGSSSSSSAGPLGDVQKYVEQQYVDNILGVGNFAPKDTKTDNTNYNAAVSAVLNGKAGSSSQQAALLQSLLG